MWVYVRKDGTEEEFDNVDDLLCFLVYEGVLDVWFAEWLENEAMSNPLQVLYDYLDISVRRLLELLRDEFIYQLMKDFEKDGDGPVEGETWKDYAGNVLAIWRDE